MEENASAGIPGRGMTRVRSDTARRNRETTLKAHMERLPPSEDSGTGSPAAVSLRDGGKSYNNCQF
jgi:hypothetical protein